MIFAAFIGVIIAFALIFLIIGVISVFIIHFAPLALAILMGMAYGWWVFFLVLILAYALYSYKGLRNAIVVVSICMAGSVIVSLLSMFVLEALIKNKLTLCFIRLAVGIGCIIYAVALDKEKESGSILPLSNYLKIPMIIQRILASAIYSFGALFLYFISFDTVIEGTFFNSPPFGIGFLILAAIVAYFLQLVLDESAQETA